MRFIFQEFTVDDSLLLVKKNGVTLEIEPRVFELLIYFCRHPNIPISRDQLIKNVWHQRVVGDAAINRAVSELRKIVECEPSKPEIIKTISKVGYQFTISPNVEPISEKEAQIKNVKTNNTEKDIRILQENSTHNSLPNSSKPYWLYWTIIFALIMLIVYVLLPKKINNEIHNITEVPQTSLKGTAYKAVLSNNGKELLFVHKDKVNGNAMVWFKGEGQAPLPITNDDFYYTFAIFSSDNEVISSRFNNLQQRKCEIVSIDLSTTKITKIIDCAERAITALAYNAQRNTLYFNYRAAVNAPYSIHAYQRSTGRLQQISFPYSDGNIRGDYMLSLSPTGDRLAVLEYQENSSSLLKTIDLSTNEIKYHQREFNVNSTLSWLSDDKILLSDGRIVMTYDINSKVLQPLLTNNSIGHVSANPTTGKIVFDKGILYANIYQYAIKHKNAKKNKQAVTHSSFLNYKPKFANRSLKSAYISTDEGDANIIIQPEKGLAYKAGYRDTVNYIGNFHFSPDDNFLIANINNQLQRFNEKDRQWQTLISEKNRIHYVHYSNEKDIIFSSDVNGDWQIWHLDTNNGKLLQLTKHGGYSAQGDINDGYLYLTKFNHAGLFRLNINTGQEETILTDFPITSWNKWEVRENTLYFIRGANVFAFDTILKTEKTILSQLESTPSSFSVSFDEQYLQHAIIEESSANIWSIETR
ncbi:winged helix-turn-helix domain-containing protein [Colwelliaceae bacterium 6471]